MWHHHFEFLLLGYGAYMTLFAFCKKAFPEITDETIARMVAGIEAEIFRPDEELRRLARRAVELGVDASSRKAARRRRVIASLESAGEAGREWLKELETRAIRGSTSMSGTASITITAHGTTTSRCLLRGCPATSPRSRRANPWRAPSRSCMRSAGS